MLVFSYEPAAQDRKAGLRPGFFNLNPIVDCDMDNDSHDTFTESAGPSEAKIFVATAGRPLATIPRSISIDRQNRCHMGFRLPTDLRQFRSYAPTMLQNIKKCISA